MKAGINKRRRLFGIAMFLALLFMADVAEAQYGAAHRATRRRTAVAVSTATHAKDEQAAQEQAAAQGEHLPYGTIVTALPEKCDPVVVDNIEEG